MNIFEAARTGNIARIQTLLDEGVNINSISVTSNVTPLYTAIQKSNDTSSLATVKFLIDHGADVNLYNKHTPLMTASERSNTTSSYETVKLLLESGADVNIKSATGTQFNALMFAAKNSGVRSSLDTVKLLLKYGTDITATTNGGKNVLGVVTSNFDTSTPETLRFLIESGADIFHKNNNGLTAIDHCPNTECHKIISEYIWKQLYNRDMDTARRYGNDSVFPKDVWSLILLNRRQQLLCSNLSSDKNKEVLQFFALEFDIPITENMTKAQLCGAISKQIVYGKTFHRTDAEMNRIKRDMIQIARKFGIDTDRPIDKIVSDLSRVLL